VSDSGEFSARIKNNVETETNFGGMNMPIMKKIPVLVELNVLCDGNEDESLLGIATADMVKVLFEEGFKNVGARPEEINVSSVKHFVLEQNVV
jgi:hypothetical protein